MSFSNVFRPLKLKNTTLRNRIVMGKWRVKRV